PSRRPRRRRFGADDLEPGRHTVPEGQRRLDPLEDRRSCPAVVARVRERSLRRSQSVAERRLRRTVLGPGTSTEECRNRNGNQNENGRAACRERKESEAVLGILEKNCQRTNCIHCTGTFPWVI